MKLYKTYGVMGLVEWNTVIKAGKAKMRIVFSGGALTAFGTTPATFSTKNPLVQNIIEHSDYFKEGRIQIVRVVEEPEEDSMTQHVAACGSMGNHGCDADSLGPGGETPGTVMDGAKTSEASEAGASGMATVKVDCLDDAREYLKEKFGCRNVRTRSDAQRMGVEHGVEFEFGS